MRITTIAPVDANTSPVLLARIYTSAGVIAMPGNFVALTLSVYDTEDIANALALSVNLTPVSSYVFSTLQTDRDWTTNYDSTGYNFAYVVPAAYLPIGGKLYQLQFLADAGNGYKTGFAFNVPTLALVGG